MFQILSFGTRTTRQLLLPIVNKSDVLIMVGLESGLIRALM